MPLDVDEILSAAPRESVGSWDSNQVVLYHLGLGAGSDPLDERDLEYLLDDRLKVLPTFGVIIASAAASGPLASPGMNFDRALMLHGEQEIVVHRPLPTTASVNSRARVAEIYDKGKAALAVIEVDTRDESGIPWFTNRFSMFLRGEGGFGGDPGPKRDSELPERAPDCELDVPTVPSQALLYRISGDRNPLHADPAVARRAGFERPILHGLCAWGITCKAIVDDLLEGDVNAVEAWSARFASPVYPGETLSLALWQEDERIVASVSTKERGNTVLSNAVLNVRS